MVKHPDFMKFTSKEVLVPITEIVELPANQIPASRRPGGLRIEE
jgi:hypothetical protein